MKCWIVLFVAIVAMQYISVQGDGSTNLYVNNLSRDTTDESLEKLFQNYGEVLEATIVRDRDTELSRGFGFVRMSTSDEADKAIEALNDTEFEGHLIRVNLENRS